MLKFLIATVLLANLVLVNSSRITPILAGQVQESQEKAGPICELCSIVLTAAEHELQNNKTEDQVITFIETHLCGKLGPMNATCWSYIDSNGRAILDELVKKVDPATVCKNMGLCASSAGPKKIVPVVISKITPLFDNQKSSPNSLNCTLCKLVFTQVQTMLQNNATDAQILTFIEAKLCAALGGLEKECDMIMNTFGPMVLQWLSKGVDPAKICQLIGMCPPSAAPKVIVPAPKVNAVNPLYCTVCEYAVQFIDLELKKNKTETNIEKLLEDTCKVLPASLKAECNSLIQTYGIYLVQLIIEMADPLKVCQAIALC